MIKVLIVDNSKVVCSYLKYIFDQDSQLKVIGIAYNGKEAIQFIKKEKPDVITMDIDMPIMDGITAIKHIMASDPIPIVVVTASRNAKEMNLSIEALAAGALKVVEKPYGIRHSKPNDSVQDLVKTVKLLSEVKVITRKSLTSKKSVKSKSSTSTIPSIVQIKDKEIIVIGISTGGPLTLQKIFSTLTTAFPIPIVVVQHITQGFLKGLVSWLNGTNLIQAKIAENDETFQPGMIYFAPDDANLQFKSRTRFKTYQPEDKERYSSVSNLFASTAKHFTEKAIAIIMTGMGKDGAEEIINLQDAGAMTIAQDKESSLIHGMPGTAIALGGIDYVLSADSIADFLKMIERNAKIIGK